MTEQKPRVWREGDDEPHEDGLRLRDQDGDVWVQLEPLSWSCNGDDDYAVDWHRALHYGPLTEIVAGGAA
ncbi:hypothetical protein [Amycolatopsis speibonae]|uniref:Uncharacterized protein n=1 Tax=Amycolatopsis speibonae TaxID=1450224 RepID=A0ABV7P4T7_9PSEU